MSHTEKWQSHCPRPLKRSSHYPRPGDDLPHMHACVVDLKLWPELLAHVFPDGFTQMARNNVEKNLEHLQSTKTVDNCVTCVYGKGHRIRFPKQSETRTKGLLDLVYTDVWRPLSVASKGGVKNFLTFIDDYSAGTVVYPVKQESEVFYYFKMFHKYAETHIARKIQNNRARTCAQAQSAPIRRWWRIHVWRVQEIPWRQRYPSSGDNRIMLSIEWSCRTHGSYSHWLSAIHALPQEYRQRILSWDTLHGSLCPQSRNVARLAIKHNSTPLLAQRQTWH